jgi:enamine deaminase RidA (YjgF/YER057c/UK114 family)
MAGRAISSRSLSMPRARLSQGLLCEPGDAVLFISGLTAHDGEGQPVAMGDVAGQARSILQAISEICEKAGGSVADVVMLTVYMCDVTQMAEVAKVRTEFFTEEPVPASTVVEVSRLVSDHRLVEIDAIASIPRPAG